VDLRNRTRRRLIRRRRVLLHGRGRGVRLDRRRRWSGRWSWRWHYVRGYGLLLHRRRFGGFFLGRVLLRMHQHCGGGQHRAENCETDDLA
jgi:hypothetical protein